jgi:thiol-disulfide isomerase/thioredoxin
MDAADPLIVACLCAQWCGVCRDWRPGFETLATRFPHARFVWIDVEDAAQTAANALGELEPESFPVCAVQRGAHLLYCDVLPQQPSIWARLIDKLAELDAMAAAQTAAKLHLHGKVGPDLRAFVR